MGIRTWWRERTAARSAQVEVYGSGQRGYMVIPRLDIPKDREVSPPAQEAVENPLLYGPIYRVAFRLGGIPIKVFRLKADRASGRFVRQEAADHPAYRLLRRPNPQITRPYLIAGTVQDLFLHRHAAWFKTRVNGKPVELWPLDAESISPASDATNLFLGLDIKVRGQVIGFIPASQVCYFRLIPAPWSWTASFTPTVPLGVASDMGFESMDSAASLFATGILERRWLHSDDELSDDAFARVQRQIEEARNERGKMPFLEGPLDIRTMGSGPDDESMMRGMDQAQRLVMETLGVPKDDDDRKFFANAIGPVADAIEQELERSLMIEWPNDPAFPEFQFRDLLKGTPQDRAQYHQTLVQSGLEMLDEGRSDFDLPPLPNGSGQRAFIPLNLVDVTETAQDGKPRKTDTSGGLGGGEQDGRGILPRVAAADMSDLLIRTWREALLRGASDHWGEVRGKVIPSQSEALARRIKPTLKREVKDLRALFSQPPARAQGTTGLPSMDEIVSILESSDPELARRIREFMVRTSALAWEAAQDLIDADKTEVAARMADIIDARVQVAVERFGAVRRGVLEDLITQVVEGASGIRELADAITAAYDGQIAAHIAQGLAQDTVGFAFEQAGVMSWAQAGIRSYSVVFGGGPCTTHVCEEAATGGPYVLGEVLPNVGYSFMGADTPPLHPTCGCYTVPNFDGGIVSATGGTV